ncbi:hypothetical protein [Nostoc sp.]
MATRGCYSRTSTGKQATRSGSLSQTKLTNGDGETFGNKYKLMRLI